MTNENEGMRRRLARELSASDIEMVRAVEDLIFVLIDKNLINLTDLPDPVIRKLSKRQELRETLAGLVEKDDDDGLEIDLPMP